jgi:hypothetical protein
MIDLARRAPLLALLFVLWVLALTLVLAWPT